MKVNDYVRTNNGLIFKIVGGNEDNWELDIEYSKLEYMEDTWLELYKYNDNGGWFIRKNCKSSPNIIDLIEVGDLVKIEFYSLRYNERVTRLFEVTFKDGEYINLSNAKCEFMLVNGEFNKGDKELNPIIKSIVTKKQFESMEYKVKG